MVLGTDAVDDALPAVGDEQSVAVGDEQSVAGGGEQVVGVVAGGDGQVAVVGADVEGVVGSHQCETWWTVNQLKVHLQQNIYIFKSRWVNISYHHGET